MTVLTTGSPAVNDKIIQPEKWAGVVVKSQPNAKNGNRRVRVARDGDDDKCFLMFQRDSVRVVRG